MKYTQEEKTAISLNKEYLILHKYATRADAPKLEADYFGRMAANVYRQIDFDQLKPKKKVREEEGTSYGRQ